jgi:hypothetical protein
VIRVTVNRDGLERGTAERPITAVNDSSGRRVETAGPLYLRGTVKVVYAPAEPLQDGARVWIEADSAVYADGTSWAFV